MTDTAETRIAAVLREHGWLPEWSHAYDGECGSEGCDGPLTFDEHAAHVASVLVKQLGLTELVERLNNAEKMVYANIGPSPILVEIRLARALLEVRMSDLKPVESPAVHGVEPNP